MNWIDLIVIFVLALFIWNGYHKGLIRQMGDLLLLVASFVISFAFYGALSTYLSSHFNIFFLQGFLGKLASLVILWVGTQIIFYFLFGILYHQVPEGVRDSKINKSFGALPGLIWGIIFIAVIYVIASVSTGILPGAGDYNKALTSSASGQIINSQSGWLQDKFFNSLGASFGGNLTFKTVEANSKETFNLGYKTTKVTVVSSAEEEMLVLLNKERTARGLKPLVMEASLRRLAEDHSRDMFARGYFSHNTPDGKDPFKRMAGSNIKYIVAGENLALAPDVATAHKGLMDSPGHRANILSPAFGKIGIGAIDGGKYGLMFSQEFTN
jgi:uncharacterized protein YkwD/uncharacterized membrane protein required for colicin V production